MFSYFEDNSYFVGILTEFNLRYSGASKSFGHIEYEHLHILNVFAPLLRLQVYSYDHTDTTANLVHAPTQAKL